jgi:hypothetical protein
MRKTMLLYYDLRFNVNNYSSRWMDGLFAAAPTLL